MKIEFNENKISELELRYRVKFINSLGGFKSVVLVGTINKSNRTNLAVFNSFFHIGANPALFGLIVRPNSIDRHTLENIIDTKQFTVNHIKKEFYKKAHQTSAKYDSDTSEFEATGLTEEYKPGHSAPFVMESDVQIGAEFIEKIELSINNTILLIAKLNFISIPTACLADDGHFDLEKAGTITCSGLDSYHQTLKIGRLAYAIPNKVSTEI